jgi:hypothetical protein
VITHSRAVSGRPTIGDGFSRFTSAYLSPVNINQGKKMAKTQNSKKQVRKAPVKSAKQKKADKRAKKSK